MLLLCRNFLFRSLQSSGWRVTKDFSTLRFRLCHLYIHRRVMADNTNTVTQHLLSLHSLFVHKCPVCFIRHPPWSITCPLFYYICFSVSLFFHCCLLFLFSVPGQSSGAFLHTLPCPGGWSNIPSTGQRWEDSREQARAWAEAQHHFSVLLQFRASGPFPPSGDG